MSELIAESGNGAPSPGRRFMPSAPRRPQTVRFRASRLVILMKLVLPALALAIIALIVSWPQLSPDHSKFRLGDQARSTSHIAANSLSMDRPRYVGVDDARRPYEITAERASQETHESQRLDLLLPQADLAINETEWMALSAATGIYDRKHRTVDLAGGVTVFHDRGYTITSERAQLLLDTGEASGDSPVSAHGQGGVITGEGFRIHDRGARIIFTGKSRAVLYPGHLGAVGAGSGGAGGSN